MADLLSDSDWNQIHGAIRDVTDTFFKHKIVLTKYEQERSIFNENKEHDTITTSYDLVCLIVPAKTGSEAKDTRKSYGSIDLSEGYILFNKEYLLENNLVDIDNNNVLINSNVDDLTYQGTKLDLIGQEEVGPNKNVNLQQGDYELFKVHFKKVITGNSTDI